VGGLVILQHNEINEELWDLASEALAPSAVCVEPMIHSRRTAEETKAKDPKPPASPTLIPLKRRRAGRTPHSRLLGLWDGYHC
jgi:hypothetical protein